MSTEEDEYYHFLVSLLPHLRDIPKRQKLAVRLALQQVLIEEGSGESDRTEWSFGLSPQALQPLCSRVHPLPYERKNPGREGGGGKGLCLVLVPRTAISTTLAEARQRQGRTRLGPGALINIPEYTNAH
jgi:hypothetical protein